MERFEFTKQYHLGLPDIDAQHARLFELFNCLVGVEELGLDRDETCFVLDQLIEYIDVHFQYEEQAMHDCGFEHLEDHRKKHVEFVRKTIALDKAFRHGEEDQSREILFFVRQWLIDHIMGEDAKYVETMKCARV